MRLSVMEFELEFAKGRWSLAASRATLLDARTVPEDEEVANLVAENHAVVRTYVNSVIGTSTMAMSAATARFEDTAALDFINISGRQLSEADFTVLCQGTDEQGRNLPSACSFAVSEL